MFDRIALISIPVKDQRAAKSFYTEKTRLYGKGRDALRDTGYVVDQVSVAGSKHRTRARHLVPSDEARFRPGSGADHKNLADTHAKLKARKLDISDIKKQPWGLEATFRDPDGNGWVMQQIKVIGNPTRVCGRPREGLEYIWRIPAYTDTFNLIASPGRGEGKGGEADARSRTTCAQLVVV